MVMPMSASRAINTLVGLGILQEITGRKRDRVYVAWGLVGAIEDESGVEGDLVAQHPLF